MIRRYWQWIGGAVALVVAACVDMSAPKGGINSISPLLLPSPSVVLGDVMRDSTGVPAPLRIIAYDINNQPIPDVAAEFFVLDRGAHVEASGLFFGDSLTTVRAVGTVAGIQTLPAPVIITVAPDIFARVGTSDSLLVQIAGDTAQNMSNDLAVTLKNTAGAGTAGFVVRYRVLYSPASQPGQPPTGYVGDESARPSPVDTTDASGRASRRAVLRAKVLGAPLPDSIVIEASAQYKGVAILGSPIRFVVRVKAAPAS